MDISGYHLQRILIKKKSVTWAFLQPTLKIGFTSFKVIYLAEVKNDIEKDHNIR